MEAHQTQIIPQWFDSDSEVPWHGSPAAGCPLLGALERVPALQDYLVASPSDLLRLMQATRASAIPPRVRTAAIVQLILGKGVAQRGLQ